MSNGPVGQNPVVEIVENCIGCKWTMRVLEMIRAGIVRPGQMERATEGLTTKVLNERLTKLQRYRLIEKMSYPEIPPRVEYVLTPFGRQLVELFDRIEQLSDTYAGHDDGEA
jgi:DNA-binding HxlR family transcriptional regulator